MCSTVFHFLFIRVSIFYFLTVKFVRFNSKFGIKRALFVRIDAREARLWDTEQVLCYQESCNKGAGSPPTCTAMHKDSLVLIYILATLFDHFLRHVCHSQIVKALVTAARGGFVIFPHYVHYLFKVMDILWLLNKHVALCLGYRQALIWRRAVVTTTSFICFTFFSWIGTNVILSVDLPSDFHFAKYQTIGKFALLIENLNMVLDHTIINYLRLKSDLCQPLFLLLLQLRFLLGRRRLIFARVLEALFMAADFIVTYFHD